MDDDRRHDIMLYGRTLNDIEVRDALGETHALIYTDGYIALTMHECCYAIWNLSTRDGQGSLWKRAISKLRKILLISSSMH